MIKVNFQHGLAYRDDIFDNLVRMLVEVIISRQLWIALYQGREAISGVTLRQVITYSFMNIAVARLYSLWIIMNVNDNIRKGDVIFDISRPVSFRHIICCQAIGRALTASLPAAIVLHLVFKIVMPESFYVWMTFIISLIFGFFTLFLIDYLISLLGFWFVEVGGFQWSKESIVAILGGSYLPLWLYPSFLKSILEWLPFRGVSYTPLAIFIGKIGPEQAIRDIAVQLAWILALALLSRLIYSAAVKKLAVQGG